MTILDVINKNSRRFFTVLAVMMFLLLCGAVPAFSQAPQLGAPTLQQVALNSLPAIPIAGNNLKFQFGGDTWIATRNGRNFIAGTFVSENTGDGVLMTLTQTHTFLRVQWIRTPGPSLVLEYKDGPPSSFRLVGRTEAPADAMAENTSANQNYYPERSGAVLAMFGVGGWFSDSGGGICGVDLFFIGKSGFTVSVGTEYMFGGYHNDRIFFPIGLGYIYFDDFYIGGIIKALHVPYYSTFLSPTIIGGYNFNGFSLGGQLSYTYGGSRYGFDPMDGIKLSLNVGVSIR
ncbi:MAG: hypothetical protein FWD28_00940 [Treponema sp.]|nr:hypothetical protein [Treponema sp.]